MSLRPQLEAIASLLEQGAADSAVKMLRSAWEPELPADDLVPLYCIWVRALCESGDLEHALVLARRAVEEFPRDMDVLIALGNVLDMRGELEEARSAFERAVELEPEEGGLQHYNLGAVLERLGLEDQAESCYRRAIESDEDVTTILDASAALGALLRRHGRLTEAAEIYDRCLEDDPINADLLVEHGICLSDLESFDEAIERFDFAISLEPDHGGALYNRAITLFRVGRHTEALVAMQDAHRADPNNPLTLAVLGAWSLAAPQSDLDRALSLLYGAVERLVAMDDSASISTGYANLVVEEVFEALWQHGRQTEAREIARLAGQRDWITSHMLDTLNETDHGRADRVTAYTVMARAEAGEAPEHWPENANGYTTGLTVLATDEDEARRFTLEYLRTLEPYPGVRFQVDVVGAGSSVEPMPEAATSHARARGVVRVHATRAYFRN